MAARVNYVLVGTYRPANESWIRERRLYNLPLPKSLAQGVGSRVPRDRKGSAGRPMPSALTFHKNISGIVLFAEGHPNFAFKAKFKEFVDGEWLKAHGYEMAPSPHAAAYALYELCEESTPAKLLGAKSAEVFVSSSRCPCVKIDEAFYSKPYPVTGGRSMPYVFDSLKPYFRKWKSATVFSPVQEDFFQDNYGFDYGLKIANGIVEDARRRGELTCVEICAGDIDCVYHFALYELLEAVGKCSSKSRDEAMILLNNMIDGKRLKDISDLPLDLAC